MSETFPRRIGFYCEKERIPIVSAALYAAETVVDYSGCKSLKLAASAAVADKCNMFMLVGASGESDDEIVSVMSALAQGKYNVVPAFVGDGDHPAPNHIYNRLYNKRVRHLGGPVGPLSEFDVAREIVKTATRVASQADVQQLLLGEEEDRELRNADLVAAARMVAAVQKPSLGNAARVRRVTVFQVYRRNGSTHTAMALAYSLRALGYSVALILPERHFRQVAHVVQNPAYVDGGEGINVDGVAVFPGKSVNCISGARYEYVIFDQGTVGWCWKADDAEKKRIASEQRAQIDNADFAVLSTLMSPTGMWEVGNHDARYKACALDNMSKAALEKVRITVFGGDDRAFDAVRARTHERCRRVYRMEPIPVPMKTIRHIDEIPPSVVDILASMLPPDDVRRARAASPEFDGGAGEQAATAAPEAAAPPAKAPFWKKAKK